MDLPHLLLKQQIMITDLRDMHTLYYYIHMLNIPVTRSPHGDSITKSNLPALLSHEVEFFCLHGCWYKVLWSMWKDVQDQWLIVFFTWFSCQSWALAWGPRLLVLHLNVGLYGNTLTNVTPLLFYELRSSEKSTAGVIESVIRVFLKLVIFFLKWHLSDALWAVSNHISVGLSNHYSNNRLLAVVAACKSRFYFLV